MLERLTTGSSSSIPELSNSWVPPRQSRGVSPFTLAGLAVAYLAVAEAVNDIETQGSSN